MTDRPLYDQQAVDQIRKELAAGMASVRGTEVTNSIAAISFEELLARAISDIEDDESDIRPGKLSAVLRTRQQVVDAVERAKQLPASMFALATRTVSNTRPDGSGPGGGDG